MKMKLIVYLLVLCLVFSTGSALANTDKTGSMDHSIGTNMDKMASSTDKAIVVFAGNVTGSVTYSVNEMNGMAGNMSAGGKTKTRNINGNLLVIKDIEKKTENIVLIGKMDGIKKPVTIMGRLDRMNKMTGNTDGMDGYLDNEKVIITGDITCNMAGKVVIIGKMNDMREMASENKGMTGMAGMAGYKSEAAGYKEKGKAAVAGYKATTAGCSEENTAGISSKTGAMSYKSDDKAGSMNEDSNMIGSMNEDNTADAMDKNVTLNAVIRCNVAGKLVIIGKMGDIKGMIGKEEMTGMDGYKAGTASYSDEEMKGMAVGKAGAVAYSKDDKKGMAAGKAGAVAYSKDDKKGMAAGRAGAIGVSTDNMKGMAAGRAGAIGVSTDNMKGMGAGKAGAVAYSNGNEKGIVAGKAGMLAYKNADITILMAGIVKCKMTGINMAVLGNMDKMTGALSGMAEEESGAMEESNQSGMSSYQDQMYGKDQTQTGTVGEKSGMMTDNMKSSTTTTKGC